MYAISYRITSLMMGAACMLSSLSLEAAELPKVLYIYGDVAADGTIPSGSKPAFHQMRLDDTSELGMSQFRDAVIDAGFIIEERYDAETTLNATLLNQYKVIILGSNQKRFGSSERSALASWVKKGGGVVAWSDSAFGGSYAKVGVGNTAGKDSDNDLMMQFGMQFMRDNAGGNYRLLQYTQDHYLNNFQANGGMSVRGEGVSCVRVSSPAIMLAPLQKGGLNGRIELNSEDGPINTATDAAVAVASIGQGRVVGFFDRNTFWNDGAGTRLSDEDNREFVQRFVTWAAGLDGVSQKYSPGLVAEFFDYTTGLSVIPNFSGTTPAVTRIDPQINYQSIAGAWSGLPSSMSDTFASRHSGLLKIDTAGTYTLFVSSDDGSRVYLKGIEVINNDGVHSLSEKSYTTTLSAGYHDLRVDFFENAGFAGLQLSWSGPGIAKQIIPASALWHKDTAGGGLPAPWTASDIGAVGLAGTSTGNGSEFTLTGSGSDIWGSADGFQFAHLPITGNGELIARVVSIENTNAWAKAGVMVRASTAPNSAHAMMVITPTKGASFQNRLSTGASSSHSTTAGITAPRWVRIVRVGTTVTGYISANGTNWTQVGGAVTVPLGSSPVIGLVVTSHDNSVACRAVFEQVVFVPYAGG